MKAERARLVRLGRLERLRAITRQAALAEAGKAEQRLAQLEHLGTRTAGLIDGYARRTDAACGGDLASQRVYLGELQRIVTSTNEDIVWARAAADARAAEAAAAERSRAAVETRVNATQARIDRYVAAAAVPLGGRSTREDEPAS
jgi:hypothetical protein